jgi:hypothetical protein
MEQARENVERILLKLWREGRADVFSDRAGKVVALLPEVGYLRRLGDELSWRLREQVRLHSAPLLLLKAILSSQYASISPFFNHSPLFC